MKGPIDDFNLVMTDGQGIEIDYGPKFRGVWLDRGELDKIIEKSTAPAAQQPASTPAQRQQLPRTSRNTGTVTISTTSPAARKRNQSPAKSSTFDINMPDAES